MSFIGAYYAFCSSFVALTQRSFPRCHKLSASWSYSPTPQNFDQKRSKFLRFRPKIPLGTTVVLGPPDTSRSARLTKGTKADGASNFENPLYLLRSNKLA